MTLCNPYVAPLFQVLTMASMGTWTPLRGSRDSVTTCNWHHIPTQVFGGGIYGGPVLGIASGAISPIVGSY